MNVHDGVNHIEIQIHTQQQQMPPHSIQNQVNNDTKIGLLENAIITHGDVQLATTQGNLQPMQDVKMHHNLQNQLLSSDMKMHMNHNNQNQVLNQDIKMHITHNPQNQVLNSDMKLHHELDIKMHNIQTHELQNDMKLCHDVHNMQQQTQQQQPPQHPPNLKTEDQNNEKKPKLEKKKKEAIDGQAKEIIFRVIKFFESEKLNRGYAYPVENVVKRACAATGLSESTIKRIKREGLRAEATQTRMTGPKKKRVRKTKVQLDYYQLCALRGIVNSYSTRKEVPTLGKILAAARSELNYSGGKESLRLILLNKLGIKFKKCEKKNKKPPEQPPPQPQHMPPMMNHQPMQHVMKPMENQCIYTSMIPQVPPVTYSSVHS